MSNVQSYQKYLSSEYPGYLSFIENIIEPIFGSKFEANAGLLQKAANAKLVDRFENIIRTSNDEQLRQEALNCGLTSMIKLGSIELDNTEVPLLVYDITISESKDLAKNRKGIQGLTRRMLDKNSGAFMIFHYADKQWEWRFSYCFKGMSDEESTDAKRFTYLLGPNQACKTAAQRFEKLRKQNGNIKLRDIEEAFNVEALSKEFFEKYKVRYGRFVGHVIGKEYVDKGDGKGEWKEKEGLAPSELFYGLHEDEKVVRDYVKKLLGRIVFLHFLQKKGWLGATDDEWTNGPQDFMHQLFENASADQKENFLDDILEPLFACLDKPLNQRREIYDTKVDGLRSVRVPFLGGLFEETVEDKALSIFPMELFADLFQFLSEYNFTIDENDPNDAQVGVDPEMLGRIFENLLEDNKDKGAFYTPKEIVQYMCRESLIAYLQTNITDEATSEALRQFVTSHDVVVLGGKDSSLALNVSQCLKDVKICDPAIGSGAFPMGLLNEIFLCRGVIEDFCNAAEIKRHIIQQNIYGVDIEKGAVEIARLRFWLSLITDADKPDVLPNMDFKIMQGNSLLEQYKGFDLSHIMDTKMEIHEGHQYQMFEDQIDVIRAEIKRTIQDYYSEQNHDMRRTMRESIQHKIQQQIAIQSINVDISDVKDIAANNQFFLWHTWFSDVFEENGGFDIVIGNPPYIRIQTINTIDPKLVPIYNKEYKDVASGNYDFYMLFMYLGYKLLNKNGILIYIQPNKFMQGNSGAKIRALIHNDKSLIHLVDFGTNQVFGSATTYTCILGLSKRQHGTFSYKKFELGENIWNVNTCQKQQLSLASLPLSGNWIFAQGNSSKLLSKIESSGSSFEKITKRIFKGSSTGNDSIFLLEIVSENDNNYIVKSAANNECFEIEQSICRKFVYGETISRYSIPQTNIALLFPYVKENGKYRLYSNVELQDNYPLAFKYLNNNKEALLRRKIPLTEDNFFKFSAARSLNEYEQCKIMIPDMLVSNRIGFDPDGIIFTGPAIHCPVFNNVVEQKYYLAILNSTLFWYYISKTSTALRGNAYRLTPEFLNNFAFPNATSVQQQSIITLVDRILAAKKMNPLADTSTEEQEIDQLVYKLYNLTPEEISIVEGKNE